jgi:hypothetical protein
MSEQIIVALIGFASGLIVTAMGWWGRLLIVALRNGGRLPKNGIELAILKHERNCSNIESVHRVLADLRKEINGLAARWDRHLDSHARR